MTPKKAQKETTMRGNGPHPNAPPRGLTLSIIIPAYNEEKTVRQVISRLQQLPLPRGIEKEIIVVNDGSTDRTLQVLQRIPGIRLISQENRGKGAAIRSGLSLASGDYVLIQDADLEYQPEEIPSLLTPVLRSHARVVYGSRKLKKNAHSSTLFNVGGMVLSRLTNLLYGSSITDEATCYKLIETKLLRSLRLEEDGFNFCPEVTAKVLKQGITIHEVPITYLPRQVADGKKIRLSDGFSAVWTLIKHRFSTIERFSRLSRRLFQPRPLRQPPSLRDGETHTVIRGEISSR